MSNLLATKLFVPRVRRELISRRGLLNRLNEGLLAGDGVFNRKLTLVSAPAGYGKTSLISEWVHWREEKDFLPQPATWLSLDKEDNDPVRFYTYFFAALSNIDKNLGQKSSSLLRSLDLPPPESLSNALINDIVAQDSSFILVLDDYHHISDSHINDTMGRLLENQPTNLHLVLITREDPPLKMTRLRGHGELVEIRQSDLRFSIDETSTLLNNVFGLQLAPEEITDLDDRSEGWIVGLQLAALALKGPSSRGEQGKVRQIVHSFTGSNRFVLDYLIEEVFRQQPEEIQTFLLRTSFLDQFSAELCSAVTGGQDSRELLRAVESANLFVIPLDEQRHWYRFHHLFADLLRFRAQQEKLDIRGIHNQASLWYQENGYLEKAIDHALSAENWRQAARLVDEAGDRMLTTGQIATFLRWIQLLPEETVVELPTLCDTVGWAMAIAGRLEAAEHYADLMESNSARTKEDDAASLALRAYIARARHDVSQTIDLSQKALHLLPATNYHLRSILGANLGVAYIYTGNLTKATEVLTTAVSDARRSENYHAGIIALSFIGQISAVHGRLRQAAEFLDQAIQLGLDSGTSPACARAHANLAALKIEWNELESAHDHLQQALELAKLVGDVHVQRDVYRIMANVQLQQGDTAAVGESLEFMDGLLQADSMSTSAQLAVARTHLAVALDLSDLAMARHWWEQIEEIIPEPTPILPHLLSNAGLFSPQLGTDQARLMLASGQARSAVELLAHYYDIANKADLGLCRVYIRVLQATAAESPAEALDFLIDALTQAQPEGYISVFTNQGDRIRSLLSRIKSTDGLRVRDYAYQLLTNPPTRTTRQSIQTGEISRILQSQLLIDPLSERELEILHLLAQNLTNDEIAQVLVISLNTVKTHLRHIYEKLNVHDRRTAVKRARAINLLS